MTFREALIEAHAKAGLTYSEDTLRLAEQEHAWRLADCLEPWGDPHCGHPRTCSPTGKPEDCGWCIAESHRDEARKGYIRLSEAVSALNLIALERANKIESLERTIKLQTAALETWKVAFPEESPGSLALVAYLRKTIDRLKSEHANVLATFHAQQEDFEKLWSKLDHAYETIDTFAGDIDRLKREHAAEVRRLQQQEEQRCISHAAYTADSDCVFCDVAIERDEKLEAESRLSQAMEALRWLWPYLTGSPLGYGLAQRFPDLAPPADKPEPRS